MRKKGKLNNLMQGILEFENSGKKLSFPLLILLHIAGWSLLFLVPVLLYPFRFSDSNFLRTELLDKLALISIFYLHYFILIPNFFLKKRYGVYVLSLLVLFLAYFGQHLYIRGRGMVQLTERSIPARVMPAWGQNDSATNSNVVGEPSFRKLQELDSLFPPPGMMRGIRDTGWFGLPKGMIIAGVNNSMSSFALILLMGGFIRLSYSFMRNQHEKKALENANLNAELVFLKSQINPHFLFNTLNSIYSQAHAKSEGTEFSVLRLSELLRYVLYDSAEERVSLEKDIQYISNYIDLQKLRLSKRVRVTYLVEGGAEGKLIAPLLLISFIENAFKHGIRYNSDSFIEVRISIFEEILTLKVVNSRFANDSFVAGGLGLVNVRRRLELLYPGRYELDINQLPASYHVSLKLNLYRA